MCLTNLKPAKMRGVEVESTAMLLAVSKNSCLTCLSRYNTGNSCFLRIWSHVIRMLAQKQGCDEGLGSGPGKVRSQ